MSKWRGLCKLIYVRSSSRFCLRTVILKRFVVLRKMNIGRCIDITLLSTILNNRCKHLLEMVVRVFGYR